jgi:integrase
MARRGSIEHRPDRPKPWRARYVDPRGHRQSASFRTKYEAERWLTDELGKLNRGMWRDPAAGEIPLERWLETWQRQRINLAPATLARDASLIRNHITPAFGATRLVGIRQEDVSGWVAGLAGGLAPITVRKVYELLAAALEAAVIADRITRSPCRGVKLPRLEDRREMRFLTPGQIDDLAGAIAGPHRAAVMLGAYAGLRWGETVALRDRRLDLLRAVVRVEETLSDVRGVIRFKEPKSKASRRAVSLPGALVDELERHLAEYGVGEGGLLFRGPEGGPLRRTNWTRRVWAPAVATSVGGALRFHELRHTHAALLIADGAHAKVVQERLGHASIRVTLDTYGHLFEGLDRVVVDGLDRMMRGAGSPHSAPKTVRRLAGEDR